MINSVDIKIKEVKRMVCFLTAATAATVITVAKVAATVGTTLIALSPFVDKAIEKRKSK